MTNKALRRAAILIASLDTQSADALLDGMSPEQAARVRCAIMDLGEICPTEQQQVMSEFVQHSSAPRNPSPCREVAPGVEVDAELVRKFSPPQPSSPPNALAARRTPPSRSFAFLDAVDAEDLARVLSGEHLQTTAIVVAHLEPARAAEVLAHLSPERQSETLMRIARLSAPHPDVIRDLEQEMQCLLAHLGQHQQVAATGLASVEAILRHASPRQRQGLVADLATQDQVLVRQLRVTVPDHDSDTTPPGDTYRRRSDRESPGNSTGTASENSVPRRRQMITFSELESLDNEALAQILRRSSPNTTLLALAGAGHDFVRKILAQLPRREAAQLDRKIQHIGPLRLDDVQRAQQQLAEVAQQLIEEGKIVLPGQTRFAVAA